MNDRLLLAPLALLGLVLVGCSAPRVVTPTLVLPVPMQVSYESELGIARLGQMLNSPGMTPEQRAELFFQRGVVFDRVGLRAMARNTTPCSTKRPKARISPASLAKFMVR